MALVNDVKPPLGIGAGKTFAEPLHLQRLEASLNVTPFLEYAQKMVIQPLSSTDDSESENDSDNLEPGEKYIGGIPTAKGERIEDKYNVYNLQQAGSERRWLQDILLTDTESESDISDEDEYIKEMLKVHVKEKAIRTKFYTNSNHTQYGYYGAGLLSNYDMFPEHQRSIVGLKKRKKIREKKPEKVKKTKKLKGKRDVFDEEEDGEVGIGDLDWDDQNLSMRGENDEMLGEAGGSLLKRSRKKVAAAKTPEMMAARRRKVWQLMAKKEVGKFQRAKVNNHKEMLTNCKRVAGFCMKIARQKAMQSQKNMKETMWRAKRLTREMQGYWKRYDRVERETRRRMEKEAEEQRKMDVELIEAKRQQRKLNFLITQTELYAHFMSKKLGNGTEAEQLRILSQLDEEVNPRLAAIDDYDSELMKQLAQKNASDAFNTERARTKQFDVTQLTGINLKGGPGDVDLPQPNLFQGSLKGYQLKGMTWLANLYDQGISGILADEMGLGKTVQSIAFLCHIAEKYGVWGPFLIISPASTLHNWQQEMQRFAPDFNVVPYWGSPNERKILRQFWEQKDLHTKDASFHVVITSYQLVVSDYKYFNRIKWQYMVLDEAQAIKSSSSVRWKLLLGFNCRNRLLLSGTPIQNSMAELWALLHFIMPTLFDSHDEFNEWFSKDIESHAENKTGIDERQISRLHMILKPFMLRRIKKDVENELSDKIEIMVYCPLTTRQKLLYVALKKKIRIEDLLHYTVGGGDGNIVDKNFTSNLMNLVMQFRKVCNHPELFERRDAKSPFYMKCLEYRMPRLVFDDGILMRSFPSRHHLIYNRFNVFKAENVQRSLHRDNRNKSENYAKYEDLNLSSTFSFTRFIGLSPAEVEKLSLAGLIYFLSHIQQSRGLHQLEQLRNFWDGSVATNWLLLTAHFANKLNKLLWFGTHFDNAFNGLLFTTINKDFVYTFTTHKIVSMPETMEHRIIRSKCTGGKLKIEEIKSEPIDDKEMTIPPIRIKSPLKSPNSLRSPTRAMPLSISPTNTRAALKSPTTLVPPMKTSPTGGKTSTGAVVGATILPEFTYIPRPPRKLVCQATSLPPFLYGFGPKVQCSGKRVYCDSRAAQWSQIRHEHCENSDGQHLVYTGLDRVKPRLGWSNIIVPDKQTLVSDAGKLFVLDNLLTRLKSQGHRVLIYSQMTKMIDLLEEYMWHRKHRYMRLDGSSKISARRDMVADFQNRADIFVFLLSTRAGGLGINLTAADTVIFYDSDWNPTVDQQAMDRAHRLGQTKQVTVYRLICKGTIEERILQRAREKSEIQRMVISGGHFKPDTLKPKEVVSLLLDDEEIEIKYRQKTEERKTQDDVSKVEKDKERKRKQANILNKDTVKRQRVDGGFLDAEDLAFLESGAPSPSHSDNGSHGSGTKIKIELPDGDDSSNEALVVDCDSPVGSSTPNPYYDGLKPRRRHHPRGTRRGRPRGSRRGGGSGSLGRLDIQLSTDGSVGTPTLSDVSESPTTSQQIPPVKRGPGRPRLKTSGGPVNKGYRGAPRPRKPVGPLVVPLGQSPAPTPTVRSPAISPAPSPAPDKNHLFYQQNDDDV